MESLDSFCCHTTFLALVMPVFFLPRCAYFTYVLFDRPLHYVWIRIGGRERREGEGKVKEGRERKERKDKKIFPCLFKRERKGDEEINHFLPKLSAFGEIWSSTKLRKLIPSNPFLPNLSPQYCYPNKGNCIPPNLFLPFP